MTERSDENAYSPMTANEAGKFPEERFGREYEAAVARVVPPKPANEVDKRLDPEAAGYRWDAGESPSKPCTVPRPKEIGSSTLVEGGEHCFCVVYGGEDLVRYGVATCCWCNERPYVRPPRQRVPGHGPGRTELVRQDE